MTDGRTIVTTRRHAPPGSEVIEPMPRLTNDDERQVFAYRTLETCMFLVATMRVEEAAAYARQAVQALESIETPEALTHVRVAMARLWKAGSVIAALE